jgi:broad specificity phosphatase PhoE
MNHLYLVRHGENLANLTKEFSYKRVDYSLTPRGELQSQQTGEYFVDKNIHEIYTSPLKRAVETAGFISRRIGVPVEVVENFREINVGDLEGRPVNQADWDLHNEILADWANGKLERCFPGGEDCHSLWKRFRAGVIDITAGKENRNIVVVAHGGILSFTLRFLCPTTDPASLNNFKSKNCSITEVLLETAPVDGTYTVTGRLVRFCAYDHLSGDAANFVSGFPKPGDIGPDGKPIVMLPFAP